MLFSGTHDFLFFFNGQVTVATNVKHTIQRLVFQKKKINMYGSI